MNDQISFVVDRFNAMLAADGARLEVSSVADGVLQLRYHSGPDGNCEACVLDPDDLEALIGEALTGKVAGLSAVRVAR